MELYTGPDVDPRKCPAAVRAYGKAYQCRFFKTMGGEWCAIHSPEAVEARAAKKKAVSQK